MTVRPFVARASEPELQTAAAAIGRRRTGNRSYVVVLLVATPTAQKEGFWVLPVGSWRIGDPQPLVTRQLADREPLEVVHDNGSSLDPPKARAGTASAGVCCGAVCIQYLPGSRRRCSTAVAMSAGFLLLPLCRRSTSQPTMSAAKITSAPMAHPMATSSAVTTLRASAGSVRQV